MRPGISGYRSYHICPVCGRQFYIPQTTDRWIYTAYRNGRQYMTCSYGCTQKARDDRNAVSPDFIRQGRLVWYSP